MRLVKATKEICEMCRFRSGIPEHGCNYSEIEGHSRIFIDGKMAYDPEYCDKFERGKRQRIRYEITFTNTEGIDEQKRED